MGRFVVLNALLGLIGGASAQMTTVTRPEFPQNPSEGCSPGLMVAGSCPTRMECFADKNFANGGRCDCNPLWFKIPGKLPFDDSEWDDGFTTSDCENHFMSRFIVGMFWITNLVLLAAFVYTDVVVIRELKRVKALKWNATSYSLFVMIWSTVSMFGVALIYIINTWGGDKTEYWYLSRGTLFVYGLMPANAIVDFEICVTWIDLYDRTNKMSKSSSRVIKALRLFLRLIAFTMSIGFLLFMLSGGLLNLLVLSMMPSVTGMIAVSIGGVLITRTLCPDKKDVSNPNWKVAEAIRRAVKHAIGSKFLEISALAGMIVTGRHPQLGYMYGYFNVLFFFTSIVRQMGWLQYIIYGSRKHLKKFSSENSSAYFGFSTIGLNKTLTSASTKMSTMSSAVSTRSTAAPSTVERD